MLEHQKIVLKGVGSNKGLFRKELIKSMTWLNDYEQVQLRNWVMENYSQQHADIIQEVLYPKLNVAS